MALPKFLQPYLASYDLIALDKIKDKRLIITEILNKGDDRAIRWMGKNYTLQDIKDVVSFPTRGMWTKISLSYWTRICDIKLNEKVFDQAIINLNQV